MILLFFLLLNCWLTTDTQALELNLYKKRCIMLDSHIVQQLSRARRNKMNDEFSWQDRFKDSILNNVSENARWMVHTLSSSLKKQDNLYLVMYKIRFFLRQWPADYQSTLPEEIVCKILSYVSYSDIIKPLYSLFATSNYCYDSIPLEKLLDDYYFISHSDLFALLKTLKFYQKEEIKTYHLGWNNKKECADLPALPNTLTYYIHTFLALSNNKYLALFEDSKSLCKGKLLFLYFSDIEQCTNIVNTRGMYSHTAVGKNISYEFNFQDHCTSNNKVLTQRQIFKKASKLVCKDAGCIWCDLYRNYIP